MRGILRGVPWVWSRRDADGGDVQHWPGDPGETGRYELWAEMRERDGECRISLHLGDVPLGESGPCPRAEAEAWMLDALGGCRDWLGQALSLIDSLPIGGTAEEDAADQRRDLQRGETSPRQRLEELRRKFNEAKRNR